MKWQIYLLWSRWEHFFFLQKEVSRNAERFRIMKANWSYNSGELWTVCVSLNTGKKMREFPRGKNPQFVTKKSMWEQHGSMPEEYIWTRALGEYRSLSPLLKDELCTNQGREVSYPRSQSKFMSRPRARWFSSIILCRVVLQEREVHKEKRYLVFFTIWFFFLYLTLLNIWEVCRES